MIFYRFIQWLVRMLSPLVAKVEIEGLEHVPEEGPFFLVANHQSYLDPILIEARVPRKLYSMTKSTQFRGPVGVLLRWLKAFPVRRFQVDPQAVRLSLRYIGRGEGVSIYIEGERSWDGRLQPPKLGAIRLLLKAGAPIVPVGISGAYDSWPRWDRRLRRARVCIRFGAPIRYPRLDDRTAREAALPAARERLMDALASLADADRGTLRAGARSGRPA